MASGNHKFFAGYFQTSEILLIPHFQENISEKKKDKEKKRGKKKKTNVSCVIKATSNSEQHQGSELPRISRVSPRKGGDQKTGVKAGTMPVLPGRRAPGAPPAQSRVTFWLPATAGKSLQAVPGCLGL